MNDILHHMDTYAPISVHSEAIAKRAEVIREHLNVYLRHGWRVFPVWPIRGGRCTCGNPSCSSPGKHPIGPLAPRGFRDATTDPARVAAWWDRVPDANIGIATGRESGLVVLDVDPRHGGDDTLEALQATHGKLPETLEVITGSKGRHLYFKYPAGVSHMKNTAGALGAGLDTRADGGYVVAPPSSHTSGCDYWWEVSGDPEDSAPAELPGWLLALLNPVAERERPALRPPSSPTPTVSTHPPARVESILEGCGWLRHCVADAATLPEPEWYGLLSVVGRCEDGVRLAHEYSRPYPQYQPVETQKKVEHALADAGPITCARVEAEFGGGWCQECAHRGQIRSPIVLGMPRGPRGNERSGRPSTVDVLIALADESGAELWHTPEGDAYATLPAGDHREHWPVGSRAMRQWLAARYYVARQRGPGAQALQEAVDALAGRALYAGPKYPVFTRLAHTTESIYLDLADPDWRAIEVTPTGWRIVENPPVRFRRPRGALPLPAPVGGGDIGELREYMNVGTEDDWRLLVSWLVGALRPTGPYPILVLQGEQGSAKSSAARLLRGLVDPNIAPVRAAPRDERDLMIAARNGWFVAFDNLSTVPDWLSDALCRIATGGGFATRTLYADTEETIINAQRPIILNGIDDLVHRDDLRDRALVLHLPVIPDEKRRDERTLHQQYEVARPLILGALLDAVSMALYRQDSIRLGALPRMADFAIWVSAAEPALPWPEGAFLTTYTGSRLEQAAEAAEYDLVAGAVRALVNKGGIWTGTAAALLEQLNELTDEQTRRSRGWPTTPRALGNRLRRIAPMLRAVGVEVEFVRTGHDRRRVIKVETVM